MQVQEGLLAQRQALNMPTATAKTYFQRAKPLLSANLQNYMLQNKL